MFVESNFQNSISFGKIKPEYKSKDVLTREKIRKEMEKQWDASYAYSYQLGRMSIAEIETKMKMRRLSKYTSNPFRPTTNEKNIDIKSLEKYKISKFEEREKNRLYTGECLYLKPEAIKGLKEAGIETILSLVPSTEYQELATKNGLNYIQLNKIHGQSLNVFNFESVEEIIRNPNSYKKNDSKEVQDLKEFVKIVKGDNPNYPLPIYMGCHWGTDRTLEWLSLYQILKDQPTNEPINAEKREALSRLLVEIENNHRW